MITKSSFLPRLTLQRGDNPVLPLHIQGSSVRKKPSEYDLSDLSPRPDDALPESPRPFPSQKSSSSRRSSSPSAAFSDRASSTTGSASKSKPRPFFSGPPPPIAASRVIYRDEEENDTPRAPRGLDASSIARNINSVLFDRSSPARTRDAVQEYEPDTIWRNIQRRERTLQKELQGLLDAQSTGLAATLDPNGIPPSARSDASDAGSSTPTGTLYTSASSARRSHVTFEEPVRATPIGEIIPVRQPQRKPLGLRAARIGLARNIALLADLKAEEDANLTAALGMRKKALSQLRKLSARRAGISEELRALEAEEEEPLTRELRELGQEHTGVKAEIAELEERLVGLRNRKRWLDGRIEDVRNRREAGLSGYKGALKEVEGRVSAILARPPVKPLDVEAIVGQRSHGPESGGYGDEAVEQSPGGAEFIRMRPERRTVDMARDWWESEVAILEQRKAEVDRERAALEEGVEVWRSACKLVTGFEADLRKEMNANADGQGKTPLTPEETMRAQLDKMGTVMAGLEERLHIAEDKGWNLLVCAIGAELAAFREAEQMLREVLGVAASPDDHEGKEPESSQDDDDEVFATPQVGRSTSNLRASVFLRSSVASSSLRESGLKKADVYDSGNKPGGGSNGNLLDLQGEEDEGDNEVPHDLLVSHPDELDASPALTRENSTDDSENEVPPEFLAQHHGDHDHIE